MIIHEIVCFHWTHLSGIEYCKAHDSDIRVWNTWYFYSSSATVIKAFTFRRLCGIVIPWFLNASAQACLQQRRRSWEALSRPQLSLPLLLPSAKEKAIFHFSALVYSLPHSCLSLSRGPMFRRVWWIHWGSVSVHGTLEQRSNLGIVSTWCGWNFTDQLLFNDFEGACNLLLNLRVWFNKFQWRFFMGVAILLSSHKPSRSTCCRLGIEEGNRVRIHTRAQSLRQKENLAKQFDKHKDDPAAQLKHRENPLRICDLNRSGMHGQHPCTSASNCTQHSKHAGNGQKLLSLSLMSLNICDRAWKTMKLLLNLWKLLRLSHLKFMK